MVDNSARERILVGVDGSESSIDALREATELAEALDAPLEAVTIWDYPVLVDSPYLTTAWSPEEGAASVLDAAIADAFGDAPPPDLTRSVVQGPTTRTLIELSRDARMLVLGSRGHGGFLGMLLGSVSAACAEHAHCPVLVVHRVRTGG